MKVKRREIRRGRVEVIPMIDTILILLIFYMTFSTFTVNEKRMDAKLPMLSTQVSPTKLVLDIVLHVHDENKIMVNGDVAYDILGLRDAMKQLALVGQEATVIIEADSGTAYQDIVKALDACALANLKKVAFRPLDPQFLAVP